MLSDRKIRGAWQSSLRVREIVFFFGHRAHPSRPRRQPGFRYFPVKWESLFFPSPMGPRALSLSEDGQVLFSPPPPTRQPPLFLLPNIA